ncbi:hypothetical protein EDEG_01080 [Edhazardia aedis USNM 41457]|uniref:Uncharacterized protein n=1 Tax=Edhazardia aedis (strain USNM 41457) TaxID=1003232 RepID=J9DTU2_EDHAE|nr:hypothetical protein EDEG_01080 [Edhazardia aedis USNM 41457]|eukprot:EJW04717.1 hypothetical protein EDEG_01080 [Edhazardia aedis USNM 41457]
MPVSPKILTRCYKRLFGNILSAPIIFFMLILQLIMFAASLDISNALKNPNMNASVHEKYNNHSFDVNHEFSDIRPYQNYLQNKGYNFKTNNSIVENDSQKNKTSYNASFDTFSNPQIENNIYANLSDPRIVVKEITIDLYDLISYIKNKDESILRKYRLDYLFEKLIELSCDEMFYQKGQLFRLILYSDTLKSIYKDIKELDIVDEEALSIISFFFRHLRMINLYSKRLENYEIEYIENLYCIDSSSLPKDSAIISLKHDLFHANYAFVIKFSGIFDLYWEKRFFTLNKYLQNNNLNRNLSDFYYINHIGATPYDINNVRFANIKYTPLITHPDEGKVGAYLNLHSLDVRHSQKFDDLKEYLEITLNSIFNYCTGKIVFEKMYEKNQKGAITKITLYGEEELGKISYLVRYLIFNALVDHYYLSDIDVRDICNFRFFPVDEPKNVTSKPIHINDIPYNAIIIDVWNYGLEKTCTEDSCSISCMDEIYVYVGLNQ